MVLQADDRTKRHLAYLILITVLARIFIGSMIYEFSGQYVLQTAQDALSLIGFGQKSPTEYRDDRPFLERLGYTRDSRFYVEIAKKGYYLSDDDYSYLQLDFPEGLDRSSILYSWPFMYPLLMRFFAFFMGFILAGLIVANTATVASVMLFYFVALYYVGPQDAFKASILFSLFPYNLLTMASFSDPLYVTFVLSSWLFYKRDNIVGAGFFAMLASLTRYPGVLLFPIITILFANEKRRTVRLSQLMFSLALFAVFSLPLLYWMFVYVPGHTGYNQLQLYTTFWDRILPGAAITSMTSFGFFYLYFAVIAAYYLKDINKGLVFYSFAFILFHLSVPSGEKSFGRYLGVVWPLFIYYGSKLDKMDMYFYSMLFVFVGFFLLELHANMVTWV